MGVTGEAVWRWRSGQGALVHKTRTLRAVSRSPERAAADVRAVEVVTAIKETPRAVAHAG